MAGDRLEALLADWAPVDLASLDARAGLQRRVDNKYVVSWEQLEGMLRALRDDHEALEIEDRHSFAYESVYFDTPALRCFTDHVQGRAPRFKVRSRLYVDSATCQLEVKAKLSDGETEKKSLAIDPDDRRRLTREGARFVSETLHHAIGEEAPADLSPALITSFRRCTVAPAEGAERITCDDDLVLCAPDGRRLKIDPECLILETKTSDGKSRTDDLLREAGAAPVSLSKYRVGMGLLCATDPDPPLDGRAAELFRPARRAR